VTTKLVSIVLDALDVEGLARFWSFALGWPMLDEHLAHDEGVVRSTAEPQLEIVTIPSTEPKREKNRVHLDLAADPVDELVERLLGAGATHADIGQRDVPWTVLADPEGNELCVTPMKVPTNGTLAAICVDSADIDVQRAFWSAATGWELEVSAEWGSALRHPSGAGPAFVLGPPVAPKTGKGRVHLDVAPPPGGDLEAEVERLLGLGARRIDIGQHDVPWTVLADPEGNELCVLTPR